MSSQLHPSPLMGSCNAMTEPTPIMHGGQIGCCSSASVPAFALKAGLPAGLSTITGKDEEALWESDWVSDWESDWESGAERVEEMVKQTIEDELEPRLKRLRPRNVATPKTDDDHPEHGIKRLKSNDPVILKQKNEDNDAEPKIMRLKCIKTLTGDDREFDDDDDDNDSDDEDTAEEEDSEDSGLEEEDHNRGSGCHFCKYSRIKRKIQCSRCPIRFCELCLLNRNGERIEVEAQEGAKWVCPKCRGGCGPGCKNCCTCPRCRRSQGLPPSGQLNVRVARQAGFDNVHDYLIHRQTGECPQKIAKRKEGRGWTKSGGAIKLGCSTGLTPAKLKMAKIWTPPHCATNWADKQTGLAWTIPKVVSDLRKSVGSMMKQRDGEQGGANKLSRDMKKPANKLEAWKLKNEQFKRALKDKNKSLDPVLNHVFGTETLTPTDIKLSLDQVLTRLLYPDDQAGQYRGPLFGRIQQIRRNRKHRNLRTILEPSMFRIRDIRRQNMATKINKFTPEFPPTVRTDNVRLDESSKAPIMPAKESTSHPSGLDLRHGQHRDRPPPLGALIPLKKPVTSLQALRKMGVLSAKRNNNADLAGQEASQKQGAAIAADTQFDPSMKHRFAVTGSSSPTLPPSLSRGQGTPQKQVPAVAHSPLFRRNLTQGLQFGSSSSASVPPCSSPGQTTSQKQGPGNGPLSEQNLKRSAHVDASSSPAVPPSVSSESGSQAILMRHSDRREKMVFRSCTKSQKSPTMVMSSCEKLAQEGIEWKGQLVRSRLTDSQSEFVPLRETRSAHSLMLARHGGVQSGFESFSQTESPIGFGAFRGDESGLAALRT